jgi:glucose/arabinose dehydrogenase
MRARLLAGAVALSLVAACGSDHSDRTTRRTTTTRHRTTSSTGSETTSSSTTQTTAAAGATSTTRRATATPGTTGAPAVVDHVKATKVATLSQPIALAVRPGEPDAVYVAEKGGRVRRIRNGAVDPAVVLNISAKVSNGGEQGLLGIAFGPQGGALYADYTDVNGDTRVVAYRYANGVADAASEKLIIGVDQPYPNHNGGQITFGPDGYLYVALGDGGSGGDPQNHAQDLGSLLGKILRVTPNPSAGGYSTPADNPFVSRAGARGEIWHYGLRNPWRWSFDRATGEQWIGDVGQGAYEEIDRVGARVNGVNFGWNKREGNHAYNGGAKPSGAVDPVLEVSHDNGSCAIVGGYVYRGAAIRGFAGTYVFTDNCRGQLVSFAGGAARDLGIAIDSPSSFGEDASGELWVLSLSGPVYRLDRS